MEFNFKIVTPESVVIRETVSSVMLGGSEGYFTIFANHSDLVARLAISTGYYIKDDQMHAFSIKGGFCTVEKNEVIVITSACVLDEITSPQDAYDKTVAFANMERDKVNEYFE